MEKNSAKNDSVHLVYKRLGETPHEAVLRFKKENIKENPELDFLPVTYAGRLDPMAEGLLLLLSGEEIVNKSEFLNLPKTYEFEVLWGFSTDTLDLLGLIKDNSNENLSKLDNKIPSKKEIQKYLNSSIKKFEQMYPIYSSRPVGGKSLFEWAREGKTLEIDIPKHEVEVFEAEYLSRREVNGEDLLLEIISKIDLVNGDFRQQEIKNLWKENMSKYLSSTFFIDSIRLTVSSGFYIRQFVSDLGENFDIPSVTYSIKRTKIGGYVI